MARKDFDRTIADITATRDGLNRTLEMLMITRDAIYPPEAAAAPRASPAVTRPPPQKAKRNGKPHEAGRS